MSTNFNWIVKDLPRSVELPTGHDYELNIDWDDPQIHIGKRTGNIHICRDCNIILQRSDCRQCPKCKNRVGREQPGNIELGLTFLYAQDPDLVHETCIKFLNAKIIEDECHRKYTGAEFLEVLKYIDNHDNSLVGSYFS